MGGIVTDLDGRATASPRLYAVGECACTGLHGANRLASNSLSECFVFGRRAALQALDDAARRDGRERSPPSVERADPRDPRGRLAPRRPRAHGRGPRRSSARPVPARPAGRGQRAAREETRGAHGRAEFPDTDPALDGHHTVLDPDSETPRFEAWTAS